MESIKNRKELNMENGMFNALPPHQAESGLVTQNELHLVQRWVQAVTSNARGKSHDRKYCGAWLDQWLSMAFPFSFRYGGKESVSILGQWQLQEGERNADSVSDRQESIWMDAATGLQLTWQVKRFLDYPAVEWMLAFENKGTRDTPIIEDVWALDLCLNHSQKERSYTVHGATGGRSLPDDMMPFSWQLTSAESRSRMQLGGVNPSSNGHLPFFNLETPENRGVLVGVGWSGNWLAQMKVEDTELQVRTGLKESHFVLRPLEKVRTPRMLLLFWEGQRLHGHNMLRQLLHKHYVPRLRGKPQKPLVSANAAFTYHKHGQLLHQATEKEVLPLVQPYIQIGAELFIIDAGWYDGQPWHQWHGNWRLSRSKYPRGFRPISESLRAANALFGLWFAAEIVSKSVPLVQEHPEWIRQKEPGKGGTLRMELPEAREWFLKQVDDLVENELMGCYRHDDAGRYDENEPDERKSISQIQHITGLYTMWDTLMERHPDIVMEGCDGGGRRIDLETLSRFHWHQKSDRWCDSLSDQCGLYGANLYLPGGLIHIFTEAVDDYGAWSSFAGQLCLGWHPLDADFPMELARRQVDRYKRIRHLLSGDFYPLTPCSLEEAWLGYQFHRVDLDKGFALLFRRFDSKQMVYPVDDTFNLCLRGLEPKENYRIYFERINTDSTLTGHVLAEGIGVVIDETPGAEMITYEPAK